MAADSAQNVRIVGAGLQSQVDFDHKSYAGFAFRSVPQHRSPAAASSPNPF